MPQGSRFILRLFGAALAGLLLASSAAAHDDEVTLERLNRKPASAREAVELLLHRAGIMRAERRLAEAEALLDQVAALDPSSPGLARARAQVALDRDRPDATLRALDACPDTSLASDPRVPWLRADALVRLTRLDEAARVMDQAIARFGFARPEQALERARVAEQRPDEGAAGALVHLDAALARWPGAWVLASHAVDLELSLGRDDAALARVDALLAAAPGRTALLARRGEVLAAAGRGLEAREAWSIALETLESRGLTRAADRESAARLRAALAQPLTNGGTR